VSPGSTGPVSFVVIESLEKINGKSAAEFWYNTNGSRNSSNSTRN
jgi:hypothetical protein